MDEAQIGIQTTLPHKRLAYRIGDYLPKWARVIYYILLIITLLYVVYRLTRYLLIGLQKAGYFCFDPNHYWVFMTCVLILIIGTLIISQFFLGLNPIGKFFNKISEIVNNVRKNLSDTIGGV